MSTARTDSILPSGRPATAVLGDDADGVLAWGVIRVGNQVAVVCTRSTWLDLATARDCAAALFELSVEGTGGE